MAYFVQKKIKGKKYLYIAWAKWINGKSKVIKQMYIGSADRVAELLKQPIPKFLSYSYGEIALLLHTEQIIDFTNILNKHLKKRAQIGDYLLLPIINRLLKPKSKAGLKDWYGKTCLPLIQNKNFSMSSQNYWYYLNRLDDKTMKTVYRELVQNTIKQLNIQDSSFLFDPTNFFTYITEHRGNTLPKKGHNKQKRFDKNQVCLSMFMGEGSQLPYDYNVYPGNVHDSEQFSTVSQDMNYNENITLVFDKGNNSEDNLDAIKDHYFIGSLPKAKKEAKQLMRGKFKSCYENNSENMIKSTSKLTEVYGIKCKLVISYNDVLMRKQLHSLENAIAKTQGKYSKIKNHLFETQKAAYNKLLEILPKKNNSFSHCVKKKGKKFRIELEIDKEKLSKYQIYAGKNIIFTNHLDWSDERIIRSYRSLYKIEHTFKVLHGALLIPIKPIFHWTDQKIKAHIFLCMCALLFAKTLEYLCRDKINGDFRKILEFASTVRIAMIKRGKIPTLVFEELSLEQQQLMESFLLSRFVRN